MTITTNLFKPITGMPVGMGAEHIEWEELLAYMLNYLIKNNLDIESPIQLKFNHTTMAAAGYIYHHGGKKYSLTPKSIVILKNYQDELSNRVQQQQPALSANG